MNFHSSHEAMPSVTHGVLRSTAAAVQTPPSQSTRSPSYRWDAVCLCKSHVCKFARPSPMPSLCSVLPRHKGIPHPVSVPPPPSSSHPNPLARWAPSWLIFASPSHHALYYRKPEKHRQLLPTFSVDTPNAPRTATHAPCDPPLPRPPALRVRGGGGLCLTATPTSPWTGK